MPGKISQLQQREHQKEDQTVLENRQKQSNCKNENFQAPRKEGEEWQRTNIFKISQKKIQHTMFFSEEEKEDTTSSCASQSVGSFVIARVFAVQVPML